MSRRWLYAFAAFLIVAPTLGALLLSHDAACRAPPPLTGAPPVMTAALHRCYGAPAVITLEQVRRPTAADEVLVRVRAASLNPLDGKLLAGKPYLARLGGGWAGRAMSGSAWTSPVSSRGSAVR